MRLTPRSLRPCKKLRFPEPSLVIGKMATHPTYGPLASAMWRRASRWHLISICASRGYFKMPDGTVVDATDWNPSWGWASGNMISTLEDMRVWARDFAVGKLLSPATKRERDRFLPAPQEGDGALYGLAIENQNGWIGHNGNIMSYMAYPYYLPSEGITMVVLLNSGADIPGSWRMIQDIT